MARRSVPLSRYLAGNILFFIVPFLVASALSLWTTYIQARNSFTDLSSLSASLVSSRFEEFFARPVEAAGQIRAILLRPDLYPKDKREDYLRLSLEGFPYVDRLQVIGKDNRVELVVPSDSTLLGVSRAGEEVFENVKRSSVLVWSGSYISTRNNRPALTFGTKAGDEVILCDLNLDWVGDYASAIASYAAKGVEIRITDGNGIYLSSVDRQLVSRRERFPDFSRLKEITEGRTVESVRADGARYLVSVAKIPIPNWYVFVLYPESAFSDTLRRGYLQLFLIFLAATLLGAAVWVRRFRRVLEALAAISSEAERISRGDYGELAAFGSGFTEFLRVGASLNLMVAAIGRRERVLVDRERGFRETLERIDLLAVGVDVEGAIRFANKAFLAAIGRDFGELEGKPLVDFVEPGPAGCPFRRLLAGENLEPLERCSLKTRDGGLRLVDWSIVRNLDAEGALAGATGIGHDVTEIVKQEELVTASLREKEILLREVHHRVKNNLQIILSLLNLQQAEAGDSAVGRAIGMSADRILSISLVHETIYGSEDFADLDFGEYAHSLATLLLSRPDGRRVKLVAELEPLRLDLLEAVPCGLFVNEAIRFLLEHASSREGAPPGRMSLSVQNRGPVATVSLSCDCPEGSSPQPAGELLDSTETLLSALAEQLHGSVSIGVVIKERPGLEIRLSFAPHAVVSQF